jgi:hypothetical protein
VAHVIFGPVISQKQHRALFLMDSVLQHGSAEETPAI